uniref:Uncharacterized protein n=1 Tax=Strigamia maritima TaxID=126957 RepID=T1INC7_STRMM
MWLSDLPTPPTPPAVRKPTIDAAAGVWSGRGQQKSWRYFLFSGDKVLIYAGTDFDNISNIPQVHQISEKFPGFPSRTSVDAITVHPSGDGLVLFKNEMAYVYGDVNDAKSRRISEMPLHAGLKYNCRGLMTDLASPIDAIVDHDKDWSTCIFIKNRTVHHNLARWEKRSIVDTLAMFLKYYPISASMTIQENKIVLFSGNRFAVLTVKENGGYWEKVLAVIYRVNDFREANDAYIEDKEH